jgi:hypothetical protein
MMKFVRKGRQRVVPVVGLGGAGVEFGVFQVGAAMTVPQAAQVRCARLE